ncbi:MAG: glycosyltransferase family 1 protein [Acidobacteriota bacterium]
MFAEGGANIHTHSVRIGIDCRKAADFGIGTYIRGLTHSLADLAGAERYVLFCKNADRELLPQGERFEFVDEASPNYSVRELFALGRQIRRNALDLFHAPHYVLPFTETPAIVTIHDLIHLNQPRRNVMERPYARWMMARAVGSSRAVLTVSAAVKDQLVDRFPEAAGKTVVTPNGVNPRFTSNVSNDDASILARLDLREGPYLLFVGNDKPHKNLQGLLQAFAIVRFTHPEIQLVVAGSQPRPARDQAAVTCTGFVSDEELHALYRGALMLVQPSLEEGFGLPVLEAMASGVPCAVSKIAALVEVGGEAVAVFDARSPQSIATTIIAVLRDRSRREVMIDRGRERAKSFTWKTCAEKTLAVYRSSISDRH